MREGGQSGGGLDGSDVVDDGLHVAGLVGEHRVGGPLGDALQLGGQRLVAAVDVRRELPDLDFSPRAGWGGLGRSLTPPFLPVSACSLDI